jgi:hypothetical protein
VVDWLWKLLVNTESPDGKRIYRCTTVCKVFAFVMLVVDDAVVARVSSLLRRFLLRCIGKVWISLRDSSTQKPTLVAGSLSWDTEAELSLQFPIFRRCSSLRLHLRISSSSSPRLITRKGIVEEEKVKEVARQPPPCRQYQYYYQGLAR